jgi:hypothetical protein
VVRVRLDVDGGGMLLASTHLRTRAELVGGRAADGTLLADGLQDAALRTGVAALGDLVADVLELAALDLELIAGRVRAGVVLYDRVEERVRDGMSRP